jgi:hypothetical protein
MNTRNIQSVEYIGNDIKVNTNNPQPPTEAQFQAAKYTYSVTYKDGTVEEKVVDDFTHLNVKAQLNHNQSMYFMDKTGTAFSPIYTVINQNSFTWEDISAEYTDLDWSEEKYFRCQA